eukprot:TRINITY_DN8013_c0_g1_i2.p1 TRINITY_DN8013_c0_g1~~TRINITY_DN8013_c0_g1_i2.p1  ORF type:complete len:383 (+),score=53.48 TRINITY_DN8013_c0_g1_i2:43-1191(+)
MGKRNIAPINTSKISSEVERSIAAGPHQSLGGTLHLPGTNTKVTRQGINDTRGEPLNDEDLIYNETLGSGSSGSVTRVVRKSTGEVFALKEIKLTMHHFCEIEKEFKTLYDTKAKQSPYVVEFHGAFVKEGSVYIALEYMNGSLLNMINSEAEEQADRGVPEKILACVTKMVLKGLQYLHNVRYLVHRDMKPSNLLFNNDGMIKITDFGVSGDLESTKGAAASFVGTVTYMAPERLSGDKYTSSVDIWGLGISIVELFSGKHPFFGVLGPDVCDGQIKFWKLVEHLQSSAPPVDLEGCGASDLFMCFLDRCLCKNVEERASANELIEHPWITEHCAPDEDDFIDKAAVASWLEKRASERVPAEGQMNQDMLHSMLDDIVGIA